MKIELKEITEEQLKQIYIIYPKIKIYKLYEEMNETEKKEYRKLKMK
jgi:hypothetical protein